MATDMLVAVLFFISIGLLVLVLRASHVSGCRPRENWTYRLSFAGLMLDMAGVSLMLALMSSAPMFLLSQLIPWVDTLWSVPMVLLLGASISALFLLRKSSQLRRKRPA